MLSIPSFHIDFMSPLVSCMRSKYVYARRVLVCMCVLRELCIVGGNIVSHSKTSVKWRTKTKPTINR